MTQPTPVSLEVVDAWTAWMVAAGAQAGPCAFDGWSARTPGGGGPGTQSVLNGA
jgi:hypothetical protein